ncbi:hypothetical protein BH23GEM6_BH23GEM6_24730 [soil metagenome]
MIELRTLGSLDLRAADGTVIGSVLAQPKRLALLVYLAIAAPGGFVRRERLLAVFWPESDDERARAAMRQAVRYLRRSLGDEVVVNRAEDELGIAAGALRCDAVELHRAVSEGHDEHAIELYAGELLLGFHIDDAPEFERWLESERTALHTAVAHSAAGLADRAAAAGDLPIALRWAREAARLNPLDETALSRLLDLLERAGDRAAALAAYETFTLRLRGELGLEPSAETRSMVERLRQPAGADLPAARSETGGGPGTPEGMGTAEPAVNSATAEPVVAAGISRDTRRHPAGRRWHHAAGALAALAVLLAAALTYAKLPARPAAEPRRVLVAPFENRTLDAAFDPVGRMAADWITEGVSRSAIMEVVPSTAVWTTDRHLAGEAGLAEPTARLRAAAQETGAGVIVSGSFYQEGAELHFQAQILDAASGRVLRPVEPVRVPTDSAVAGIDRLRDRVVDALAPLGDTISHLRTGGAPPTYEAYRQYLAGMDAFVGGDPATALLHYDRAATADSTYPMPRLAAAIMYMNLGDFESADSIAAAVETMRDRLGPLERSTHEFVLATLRGDQSAAYRAMSRAAGIAPGTINEYMVGELARRLNRPREALRVLHRMGPDRGELRGWHPYWREVAWSNHMLGDHRGELRAARKARQLHPAVPQVLSLEVRALAALGRVRDVDARIEERLATTTPGPPSAGELMALAARELDAHGHGGAAARMWERSLAWLETRPEGARRSEPHRYQYAVILGHVGRFGEARSVLEWLVAEQPGNRAYLGRLGLAHAALGQAAEARRIDALLARDEPVRGRVGTVDPVYRELLYLRAAIAAHLARPDEAVDLLRQSHALGHSFAPGWHSSPDLAPLRNHPAFRELLRPKG